MKVRSLRHHWKTSSVTLNDPTSRNNITYICLNCSNIRWLNAANIHSNIWIYKISLLPWIRKMLISDLTTKSTYTTTISRNMTHRTDQYSTNVKCSLRQLLKLWPLVLQTYFHRLLLAQLSHYIQLHSFHLSKCKLTTLIILNNHI